VNIDYKYFAGSKDPIEIINKYRMRGFGTILNNHEIVRFIEYSNLVTKWKELYHLNINSHMSVINILGQLDITHQLYNDVYESNNKSNNKSKGKAINKLCKYNYKNIPSSDQLISLIKQIYETTFPAYDMTHVTTINKYGYVNIAKKWLIDAFYDTSLNNIYTLIKHRTGNNC
jgi:hypothetical protein